MTTFLIWIQIFLFLFAGGCLVAAFLARERKAALLMGIAFLGIFLTACLWGVAVDYNKRFGSPEKAALNTGKN